MKLEIIFFGLVAIYSYFYKSTKSALLYTCLFVLLCLARNSVFLISLQVFSFNPIYLGLIIILLFLLMTKKNCKNNNCMVAVIISLCLYILLTNLNVLNVFSINFSNYALIFGVIMALISKSNSYISTLFFVLIAELYNFLIISKSIGHVGIFTIDTMVIVTLMLIGCVAVNTFRAIYRNKKIGVESVY